MMCMKEQSKYNRARDMVAPDGVVMHENRSSKVLLQTSGSSAKALLNEAATELADFKCILKSKHCSRKQAL